MVIRPDNAKAPASIDMRIGTIGNNVLPGTVSGDVIAGLGGKDVISGRDGEDVLYGEGPGLFVDGASVVLNLGSDVIVGGSDYDVIFGDVMDLRVKSGIGDVAITFGSDLLVDGDSALIHGDASSIVISASGSAGGSVEFVTGDDTILSVDGTMIGDSFEIRIEGLDGGSVTIDLGDDTLIDDGSQWDYHYGDVNYVFIDLYGGGFGRVDITAGDDLVVSRLGDGLFGDFDTVGVFNGDLSAGTTVTITCGNDVLVGGTGNDWMIGDFLDDHREFAGPVDYIVNPGQDTFVFRGDFGNDDIVDFNLGLDTLFFAGFGDFDFDDLTFSVNSNPDFGGLIVIVESDLGNGTILLRGVHEINASDVLFA